MDIAEFKEDHLKAVQKWKDGDLRFRWYERYNEMLSAVAKIKSELESGGELDISNPKHKDFLHSLLLEDGNGISHAGFGDLKPEDYNTLISDSLVLKAIEAVIKNPTVDTCEQVTVALCSTGRNYWLIASRVVAASTLKVSSTVDHEKFSQIYNWFLSQGIIESKKYHRERAGNWYNKNVYLMKSLYEIFDDEIKNGDTDKVFISMYVWQKWEEECELKR